MKIRTGFVSNSSSSSFVLDKNMLSKNQIDMIKNHIDHARKLLNLNEYVDNFEGTKYGWLDYSDAYNVIEKKDTIVLSTTMDNFYMYEFLKDINAYDSVIEVND